MGISYLSRMQELKKEIKSWLKKLGKTRYWLAEKTYSTKPTVDGWLSTRGVIPRAKQDVIRGLMRNSEKVTVSLKKSRAQWRAFCLMLHSEDYNIISRAAKKDNMPVEAWCERELIRAAKKRTVLVTLQQRAMEYQDKASEEPEPYGSKHA